MSKFHLPFPKITVDQKIKFSDSLCFLGSCFSSNINTLASDHGYRTLCNPFGTIFHPEPILNCLKEALDESKNTDLLIDDQYVTDWNSAHVVQSSSKETHQAKVLDKRRLLKKQISGDSWLFITLGTSIGYRHNELNKLVANCHKQHPDLFEKVESSPSEMFEAWNPFLTRLLQWNPKLKIIFTVSPVRHVKDGLISNTQSKARLFVFIEALMNKFPISYFPSYEIINDSLRDYRFFNEDLIHPNKTAVNEIWAYLLSNYMSTEDQVLAQQINKVKRTEQHRKHHSNKAEDDKLNEWLSKQKLAIKASLNKRKLY
ncbi:MAG: GSCFA domain-containing protein [Crocinitomicaceae bacterium]|jgi:hypothetical protein|tara:strand:+ start:14434 stop:15378 length:945 start_codon:yes stop_codon:yes gene_type:complete